MDKFTSIGIEPPSGVLLYGPPGTGKTLIARAVASETDATFLKLAASELAQKFIGEGSRLVRDLFEVAEEKSPSIIFLDEIDAIATKRRETKGKGDTEVQRTLMQLLSEMDGFSSSSDVRVVAATNRFDMLDEAILRPGRFDRLVEISLPDKEERKEIFSIHTRDMKTGNVDYESLSAVSDGLTGADIQASCTEAGMMAIRQGRDVINQNDLLQAVNKVQDDEKTPVVTRGFN